MALAAACVFASPSAEAQKFPSYVTNCNKAKEFERSEALYTVPATSGGVGQVQVVSQNWECEDKSSRLSESVKFHGMKNASGKLVIPYAYQRLLPISTTGAVVGEYGPNAYAGSGGYRVYLVGKGTGKELFRFDVGIFQPNNGCPPPPGAAAPVGMSVVIGSDTYRGGGGKEHLTLFAPDGTTRRFEAMGGDGIKPAVRRVGDVLLVRWRDDQGALRSGILDLYGRPVAPVLSNAALWITPTSNPLLNSVSGCNVEALDLFIEGPSLDFDPSQPFFGPLLIPVGRDGQPVPLPKGAIGVFPVWRRENQSAYSDAPRDMTSMWAVVFPKGDGFEFTLHLGSPSEALLAAETGPRYVTMARTDSFGGLVTAQRVSDQKWTTFRASTMFAVGDPDADFDRNLDSAWALLEAQDAQRQQELAAAQAKWEAERAETHKRNWETARKTGSLCRVQVDATNTRQDFDDYLAACGPDNFSGFRGLALAKGMTETELASAASAHASAQAMKMMEVYKSRTAWEEEQRVLRQRNANQDPGASYYPGQWESAIRNAGDAATDAINESADNWLQQRRDQYIADWQRSQRAY